jgi:hypothetical protein
MLNDEDVALQGGMSTHEILQRFRKVFGREMRTSEREDFFVPNQGASPDEKG